jgi:hypothetical protein
MNLLNFTLTPNFGRVRKRFQLTNIYPNHEVIITTYSVSLFPQERSQKEGSFKLLLVRLPWDFLEIGRGLCYPPAQKSAGCARG